jgi:Phosphotransferase enzyme family
MVPVHPQPGRDRYRMIVLQTNGNYVLLSPEDKHFVLPEVEIPAFERVAQHLTAVVRREWGQEILCLFPLPNDTPPETPHAYSYSVAEALDPQDRVGPSRWVSVESLRQDSFADVRDYQALRCSLCRCSSEETISKRDPFEKLGWLSEARTWIAETIEPSGLRLSGPFRQLNASPTFSLIRFETNGPAVWFKAVGEPNLREFPISRELGRFFPAFVPTILSMREDWNAWLTLEMDGTHPDESSEIGIWTAVAKTLADLQIASIGSTLHLINAGCRDARIPALHGLLDPFLDAMAGLMNRQTKQNPPPLSQLELQTLRRQLEDALFALQDSEIPDTLGHLDFNPGNLLANGDHCIFLDWAEGCVGPPFLTFQYLRQCFRRLRPQDQRFERALTSAYVVNLTRFARPREIDPILSLAPLLAVFAFAAVSDTWRDPARLRHPKTVAYLRSLTRRMKREGDLLLEKRSRSQSLRAARRVSQTSA